MKKLEDIPKKDVFKVPDGYFEDLPGIIQARVAQPETDAAIRPVSSHAWRYALACTIFAVAGVFWLTRDDNAQTPESILASIDTADLVAYLNNDDLTTEELLNQVSLDAEDADQIEEEVYGQGLEEMNFDAVIHELY